MNCGATNRGNFKNKACYRCGFPIKADSADQLALQQADFRQKKADQIRAAKMESRALG